MYKRVNFREIRSMPASVQSKSRFSVHLQGTKSRTRSSHRRRRYRYAPMRTTPAVIPTSAVKPCHGAIWTWNPSAASAVCGRIARMDGSRIVPDRMFGAKNRRTTAAARTDGDMSIPMGASCGGLSGSSSGLGPVNTRKTRIMQ